MVSNPGTADPELGRPVSVHRGRLLAGGWSLYLGPLLLASGVLSLGKGGSLAFSAAILAVAGLMLYVVVGRWTQRLTVYEGGLVRTRFGRERRVRWDEVTYVEAQTESGLNTLVSNLELTVSTRRGGMVVLKGFTDIDRLHGYLINAARTNYG
jgi:hypothetical protein